MMATTIINSMSVKPRWLRISLGRRCQNFVMDSASIVPSEISILHPGSPPGAAMHGFAHRVPRARQEKMAPE
jgi:hypothetical protein